MIPNKNHPTFVPPIYSRQDFNLVELNPRIISNKKAWPRCVYVLTPQSSLEDPFTPLHAPYHWAMLSFRDIGAEGVKALKLWMHRFDHFVTFLISKRQWKGTHEQRLLVYNATWASFGYIQGQSKEAIALAKSIIHNPNRRKAACSIYEIC